jgi:hypothetical protein
MMSLALPSVRQSGQTHLLARSKLPRRLGNDTHQQRSLPGAVPQFKLVPHSSHKRLFMIPLTFFLYAACSVHAEPVFIFQKCPKSHLDVRLRLTQVDVKTNKVSPVDHKSLGRDIKPDLEFKVIAKKLSKKTTMVKRKTTRNAYLNDSRGTTFRKVMNNTNINAIKIDERC